MVKEGWMVHYTSRDNLVSDFDSSYINLNYFSKPVYFIYLDVLIYGIIWHNLAIVFIRKNSGAPVVHSQSFVGWFSTFHFRKRSISELSQMNSIFKISAFPKLE